MSIEVGNLYQRKSDHQLLTVISYTETLVQYKEEDKAGTGSTTMERFYTDYEAVD